MDIPVLISKIKLYELAQWVVGGMTILFGLKYLKQVIVFVMTELYKLLIQEHVLPV